MPDKLIIAGLSCRAYVEMAVSAGYEVVVLDAFADVDTRQCAAQTWPLALSNEGLVAAEVLEVLGRLPLADFAGFCYGAGFESQPELLGEIATRIRVIGNHAETVRLCKSPEHLFALCERVDMPYPPSRLMPPERQAGWLYKQVGGSGGNHVTWANVEPAGRGYFQQQVEGKAFSCLFVGQAGTGQVIGFNEQWCSPSLLTPFRYGGAVSQVKLPEAVKARMVRFVADISRELGLQGLNSADFIWDGEHLYALEINPRLSATAALYRAQYGKLFDWHLGHCTDLSVDGVARAHQVVYAEVAIEIGADWDWPAWVSDIPWPNSRIAPGWPICTINTEANDAEQAKKRVLDRYQALQEWLNQKTIN